MKKIIPFFLHIREKYRSIKQRFGSYRMKNWQDTGTLLYWAAIFLFSLCVGLMSGTFMQPVWLGTAITAVLTVPAAMAGLWLSGKLLKLFLRNGVREFLSWLLLCMVCILVMTGDAFHAGLKESVLTAAVFSLVLALLLKSLWAAFHHKVRTRTIAAALALTGIFTMALLVLLAGRGFEDTYIEIYGNLRNQNREKDVLTEQEKEAFEEGLKQGPCTVKALTYGTENSDIFPVRTVNISRFAENEGLDGFMKEHYQGYSLEEVPLSGMVWYPEEQSDCPVLFIVHGNHNWVTDSYLGYEYLGTYLASHGYVVVSVDENACNGLSGENDGRAVLLLEHMDYILSESRRKDSPLYQKTDENNLALAGHSRGGEAIAAAYLFNELDYYPDNGNRTFDYHFSIRSLIAIAPTCGQYLPSGRDVELKDVNYMVLHGANDQDVATFMGMEQYENVTFSGEKDCIKTSLYVAGANHGQFNSLWGSYDLMEPLNRALNVKNFISMQEQQQIAKVFIRAFLEETLKETAETESEQNFSGMLLTDYSRYEELLPETLYIQSYQTSDLRILCNFEEDTRLETGTAADIRLEAEHVNSWREELLYFSDGNPRGNYAAVLKWEPEEGEEADSSKKEPAEFSISMPETDLTGKHLQFDVMDLKEDFPEEEGELPELEIIVEDSQGQEAVLKAEDYASLYPAFPVRLNKLQYLWKAAEYKHQFQTVSIPMEDFTGVDRRKISRITICFLTEKGKTAIDNVGIR